MQFPVYLRLGTLTLHPHVVFETLAWTVGAVVFLLGRSRARDVLSREHRLWVIVAAVLGGLAGSRLLVLIETAGAAGGVPDPLSAGKSIVGGLLGGVVAVEATKRWLGVTKATGDLLVMPLLVGMAIGRVGCFLTGLADQTHGIATTGPWAVDFGDGVPRHPTQLYEIAALGLFGWLLATMSVRLATPGDRFKLFMVVYLAFRLLLDFWKPGPLVFGMTAIQWACVAGLGYYTQDLPRLASEVRHG